MSLTLLLDLDDTLLNTNISEFIPAYFQSLARELSSRIPPEKMMRALLQGTNAMNASEDFTRSLKAVFEDVFLPAVQTSRAELEPAIEHFYEHTFPTLQPLTSPKPEAKPFVEWARSRGFRIAIATDPLLPLKANQWRLRWAGFDPQDFALVSAYEHYSFTKNHPAYYAEVLGQMGWVDGPVLMVGNDMERDILPAQRIGLATYHLREDSAGEDDTGGTFADLPAWIESHLKAGVLFPVFQTPESIISLLAATPAVLNRLTCKANAARWAAEAFADGHSWSLLESICHLRDSEREIHHVQIKLFEAKDEPFIHRPEDSVWVNQRDYAREDGFLALAQFNQARAETLAMLKQIRPEIWSRKARHAIFGPTHFLEVMRFICEHDRLHIHQAWETLSAGA